MTGRSPGSAPRARGKCPECGTRVRKGPGGWVADHRDPLASSGLCPGSTSVKGSTR